MKSLLLPSIAGSALLLAGLLGTGLASYSATAAPSSPGTEDGCDPAPPLSDVAGVLAQTGQGWTVDGTEVDFGPPWHLATTGDDYDADGTAESLADEFAGLVGSSVVLTVDAAGEGGDRDVYTVNGMTYREPDGCPPPWSGGPPDRPRQPVAQGDAESEPVSPEGTSPGDTAVAFVAGMQAWAACVAAAAPGHESGAGFDPVVACGAQPMPPGSPESGVRESNGTDDG